MQPDIRSHLIIGLLLALSVLISYGQVAHHDFVDLDDRDYIVENRYINKGLNMQGLIWAFDFRHSDKSYWRPLTWLTHMLDFQIFGANPGPAHLVNLGMHLANVLLLYAVLGMLAGPSWCAAFVSFLFAVHPINVESVAWLTERSNLLGTFFGLATMAAYVAYARKPVFNRYLLVLLVFLLCLLAKPILVTLPFLMLLLDYWPLGRLSAGYPISPGPRESAPSLIGQSGIFHSPGGVRTATTGYLRLVAEKIPLLIMVGGVIYASILRLGYTAPVEQISWLLRLENALVAYVRYIAHLALPIRLAAFYPFPASIPVWQWLGALTILAGITGMTLGQIRRRPYLFVGWFWYLGTLFPKIGFVQAGLWPALADRWVYFPAIGLFLAAAWWLGERTHGLGRLAKWIAAILGVAVGLVLVMATSVQVDYWRNSRSLFERMLALYPNNFMGQNNLGLILRREGNLDAAEQYFSRAITINPKFEIAYLNLGHVAAERGDEAGALEWYRKALELKPDYLGAHLAIGGLHLLQGKPQQAARHYARAVQIDGHSAAAINGLGGALVKMNRLQEAVSLFEQALEADPSFVPAQKNLSVVKAALGRP
jgi:tetratricopeptide (TPR) repeat protein